MPGALRAELARELAELNATRESQARRELARAAARLERAGWTVSTMLRAGVPADELTHAVASIRADTLVVGARGTAGVSRLLLGSVAEGVLDRCPASILLVR
jgi:universal stress protein A